MPINSTDQRYLDKKFDRIIELAEETNRLLRDLRDRIDRQNPQTQVTPAPYTLPFPYIPSTPPLNAAPSCPVCGIGSNGPMGYVCTRRDCPSGVVTCSA